jgi:hypothetical protein
MEYVVESVKNSPSFRTLVSKEIDEFGDCSPEDLPQHISSYVTHRMSKQPLKIRRRGGMNRSDDAYLDFIPDLKVRPSLILGVGFWLSVRLST